MMVMMMLRCCDAAMLLMMMMMVMMMMMMAMAMLMLIPIGTALLLLEVLCWQGEARSDKVGVAWTTAPNSKTRHWEMMAFSFPAVSISSYLFNDGTSFQIFQISREYISHQI